MVPGSSIEHSKELSIGALWAPQRPDICLSQCKRHSAPLSIQAAPPSSPAACWLPGADTAFRRDSNPHATRSSPGDVVPATRRGHDRH